MKHPIYFKQLEIGPMQNYVYLLGDPTTHEAAVVDAAWDVDMIVRTAEEDGYRVTKDLVRLEVSGDLDLLHLKRFRRLAEPLGSDQVREHASGHLAERRHLAERVEVSHRATRLP